MSFQPECEAQLRRLMEPLGLTSWRSLSVASGVSLGQIRAVRQGKVQGLTLEKIDRLAQALGCSRSQFLNVLDTAKLSTITSHNSVFSEEEIRRRFQAEVLDQLESFLRFWPVAAARARQDATLPAVKLLPLVTPIEGVLASWGGERIGEVGESVVFDPAVHEAMGDQLDVGDRARVTHCGYRQGDRLLFRAKVTIGGSD